MKKINLYLTIALLTSAFMLSCNKETVVEFPTWNALAFCENPSDNYLLYMDDPYVNLTFPGSVEKGEINYINGSWMIGKMEYVFIAHNWGEQELIIYITKKGAEVTERVLLPQPPVVGSLDNHIKKFSLKFDASVGEYSFNAAVKDHRGVTPLLTKVLHNSSNKLVVK
ncbi:MAG: hypothetical protein A2X20_08560 [Bacteroidetes bacterium GWE2_40_15]|nr:MAG: hypothetical protein A2X20_08560 [Bacteroidetes bacterium GWE2_40_15]